MMTLYRTFSAFKNLARRFFSARGSLRLLSLFLVIGLYATTLFKTPGFAVQGFKEITFQHIHFVHTPHSHAQADANHHHHHDGADHEHHEHAPLTDNIDAHQNAEPQTQAHTHVLTSGFMPLHSLPSDTNFEGLQIASNSISFFKLNSPPMDPHLGSIFRPPIA